MEGVKTRGAKLVGILGLVDFPAGVGNLVKKFWRGWRVELRVNFYSLQRT